MGIIATLLAVVFNWGGLCIDTLRVASPAAIWGEWCACGPMLLFTILAPIEKEKLTKMDLILIFDFFLCLFSGFLSNIPHQSHEMGIFWMSFSCATYFPFLFLPIYVHHEEMKNSGDEDENIIEIEEPRRQMQRHNLALWFTFCMPLFAVIYILAYFGFFSPEITVLLFQFFSMATKGLYAAVLLDIHKDALILAEFALSQERRANESRRAFLKYLFHEVRSPLNSLSIGIEILDRCDKLESEERDSLLMMRGASEYMAGTLNDVLSMQKIEEGKLELDLRPFSIEEVVYAVFATFKGSAIAKGLQLHYMIASEIPAKLIGDRFRLEHVVGNFLSNAIKFSPQGGRITVEVSVPSKFLVAAVDEKQRSQNNMNISRNSLLWTGVFIKNSYAVTECHEESSEEWKNIMLSVSDEGPGIPQEYQGKLFGNFVQIRPGELQNGQGSGLGLSLCKQIVLLHGGKVGVESEEGKGSKFYFIIPFLMAPECSKNANSLNSLKKSDHLAETPDNVSGQTDVTASQGQADIDVSALILEPLLKSSHHDQSIGVLPPQPISVLIVDDVESNRKMLRMLLKQNHVTSQTAENGQIAVEVVLKDVEQFQIIFMDNQMPILGGVDATKLLRASGYKHLIVGVTGYVLEEDVNEYLAAGADLVLSKPLRANVMNKLLQFVRENGCLSIPGMSLSSTQSPNTLTWVV
eukprot:CAMPEP_0170084854 /NCGR_PEP_ID=MMETSP0019_2-20121128/19914_1 /TAXON_ID=98059 /ORGANISM="Dinobryon sp., Strain UTEXLB2267" /LENGTH=692 /DNA_ID=CAMNT_0010301085 /DNA_START=328 /DNA_END=2406 /DNA_ORIENTATION=-